MDNYKIGIFDSGIGGMSTMEEIIHILPNEDIIYYADRKNNPYGNKNKKEILRLVSKSIEYLVSKKAKLIVVACNTVTTSVIKVLRKKYPNVIIIGTVPAVKVACDKDYRNILVLSTVATSKSKRLKEIINDNKKDYQKIEILPCRDLAGIIETKNDYEIDKELNKLLSGYNDIDSIVLGCTHYSLIKDKICKLFPETDVIDGNNGVAREVKRELEVNNLLSDEKVRGNIRIIVSLKRSKNDKHRKKR